MKRYLPTFSTAFSAFYAFAAALKLPLFRYYPATKVFSRSALAPSTFGPGIDWYGWIATALLGSLAACALAALVPERWRGKALGDLSWLAPVMAFSFLVYLARGWFIG